MSLKNSLIIGAVVALLLTGVFGGWQLRKYVHPDPIITHDTSYVEDPKWHHMYDSLANAPPKEVWKWHPRDTIKLPGDTIKLPVDSTAIKAMLRDYLATYDFGHPFTSDSLDANIGVRVNRNHPIAYSLDYKFKKPFTTVVNNIDNSINYTGHILLGLSVPMFKYGVDSIPYNFRKTMSVDLNWVSTKGYVGVGWEPFSKVFTVKLGTNLINFKSRK